MALERKPESLPETEPVTKPIMVAKENRATVGNINR